MSEPAEIVEMRAALAQARQAYDVSVRVELEQLAALADRFRLAIGEVSAAQALDGWKRVVIEYLYHRP